MSTRFQRTPKGTIVLTPGSVELEDVQLVNRVQNIRLEFTIEADVTVVEDGGVALVDRVGDGRLSNLLLMTPINENGTDMIGECSGRAFRLMAEAEAGQPFPFTQPPLQIVAAGVHRIREVFNVNFAHPLAVDPFETSYMEADPNSPLFCKARFSTATPVLGLYDTTTGTTTLGNVTITVRQVFDPARTKLPYFTPRVRNIASQNIVGTNPEDIFRLPTKQRVASLTFLQNALDALTGVRLPEAGFVNALRLIGDDGRNLIGPGQIAWQDLVDEQAALYGGQLVDDTYHHSFVIAGRMSYTPVFEREYPNARAEVDDDAAGGAGTSPILNIVIKELIARAPVNGYATVMPRFVTNAAGETVPNPEFPDWAR